MHYLRMVKNEDLEFWENILIDIHKFWVLKLYFLIYKEN